MLTPDQKQENQVFTNSKPRSVRPNFLNPKELFFARKNRTDRSQSFHGSRFRNKIKCVLKTTNNYAIRRQPTSFHGINNEKITKIDNENEEDLTSVDEEEEEPTPSIIRQNLLGPLSFDDLYYT